MKKFIREEKIVYKMKFIIKKAVFIAEYRDMCKNIFYYIQEKKTPPSINIKNVLF